MPAVPKWFWPLTIVAIGLLVLTGGLMAGLGLGGSMIANLAPEGFYAEGETTAISMVTSVSGGVLQVPPILDWIVSNRTHNPGISPALDIVSDKDRGKSGVAIVYAPIGGTVEIHPNDPGYGNYVMITSADKTTKVLMGHMDPKGFPLVKNGSVVLAGTPLGYVGNTGKSNGPHVHLEVFRSGVRVDPEPLLPKSGSIQGKAVGEGVVAVPQERTVNVPGGLKKVAQWFAGLATAVGEAPARWSGKGTAREATSGQWSVTVTDSRVDRYSLKADPDARKIATKLAELLPGGKLEIVLVDRICSPAGCFPGRLAADGLIEIDPGHDGSKDLNVVLRQLLREYVETKAGGEMGSLAGIDWGNLTTADDAVVEKAEKKTAGDELAVHVFYQPGDGVEAIKPIIERLRMDYPWVAFDYQDVSQPEGNRLAVYYQVKNTPTTVLARAGNEVWTWEGAVAGLEDLLQVHQWLGRQLMANGQVALLGPAGKIPNVSFAGTYGALCHAKGSLGLLGSASDYPLGSSNKAPGCTAEGAMELTTRWGAWVGKHNGGKVVINTIMPTVSESNGALIQQIIEEAGRRNAAGEHWYILLDVQKASQFDDVLTKYVTGNNPHVGIIFDLEWFGRATKVSEINAMAEKYFQHRESLGLKGLGIIGVWYFRPGDVVPDEPTTRKWEKDEDLKSSYSTGIVVPIMDGYGGGGGKMANYKKMLDLFRPSYSGMMGFTWRWGSKYDSARPEDIFDSSMLFWTQQ